MERAQFDLADIENGVRDTFQTAGKVDAAKLGYKPNKIVQGIFFSNDISTASGYAWPRPENGKKGEKGQPTPVIFDILIGTEENPAVIKHNDYQKPYVDGFDVFPLTAKEYLGETRHVVCQPSRQKLVNLSKWGLGGVAVAATLGLGKTALDQYQAGSFSLGTSTPSASIPQQPTAAQRLRLADEQFDTYTVLGS